MTYRAGFEAARELAANVADDHEHAADDFICGSYNCGTIIAATIRQLQPPSAMDGWQPIESAPRDGTYIIAWCVHDNAKYSKGPINEGWATPVIARWIGHNGGGWCWHGHAGVFTHWQPLQTPPSPERG